MKIPYQFAGHLPGIFLLGKPEEKAARQEKVTNPNYSWTHGPGFKFKRRATVEVQVRAQIAGNAAEVGGTEVTLGPNKGITPSDNLSNNDIRIAPSTAAYGKSTDVQTEYVTRSEKRYPSINSLPEPERTTFLKKHDPVQTLGLTDESKFYRVAAKSAILDSRIRGGAEEVKARISNHLALADSPAVKRIETALKEPDLDEESRNTLTNHINALSKVPLSMEATDLPDSGINVMYGPDAIKSAMDYMKSDRILIEMNLGDFRRAGGGVVFRDIGSAGSYTSTVPLFISLPEGATIPVKIVAHES